MKKAKLRKLSPGMEKKILACIERITQEVRAERAASTRRNRISTN
jgi:hypothetical protein